MLASKDLDLAQSEYLKILKICRSLETKIGEKTYLVYEALERLCELYKNFGNKVSITTSRYIIETDIALSSLKKVRY